VNQAALVQTIVHDVDNWITCLLKLWYLDHMWQISQDIQLQSTWRHFDFYVKL